MSGPGRGCGKQDYDGRRHALEVKGSFSVVAAAEKDCGDRRSVMSDQLVDDEGLITCLGWCRGKCCGEHNLVLHNSGGISM